MVDSEKNHRARKGSDPYPSHAHERKRRQTKTRQAAAEWTGETCDRADRPLATATEPESATPEPATTKTKGKRRDG